MSRARDFQDWDAGLHRSDPNSLKHYGVLGMKWGQRRYQKSDGSLTAAGKKHYENTGEYGYTYKSHATKKYTKKLAKAEAKGKTEKAEKMERRLKRSKELDRREQNYAQQVRTGGNVIARYLTGGAIGGKAYQQHLAMNKDTKTTGSKASAALLSAVGGTLGSRIRKANYIRQDEKAAKRAKKGKAADRGAAFRERAALAKQQFENGVNNVSDVVKKKRR